jgi:hypothetical protein
VLVAAPQAQVNESFCAAFFKKRPLRGQRRPQQMLAESGKAL